MRDFDTPVLQRRRPGREGFPAGAEALCRRLEEADGFVIASPEYNASMPGLLKNTIDWVSRFSPQPFNELHGLLLSASPSMVGGNRGLWALRVPFEHLGARVYPGHVLARPGPQRLRQRGSHRQPRSSQSASSTNIDNFMDSVEANKHYPCIKSAWVEYLGEHPEPAIDRVQ